MSRSGDHFGSSEIGTAKCQEQMPTKKANPLELLASH